ncbi:hypothetical protein IHE55_18985 [Streptomyces pactum]|uniref:Secreted protein n=1 Tax=Streptomyces pactum TaxID=68249 RepID=A0ABS0NNH4_9ACTN|nr:hypothetical protein [Streptomyces pactum]MBH5336741.1 hypothetical protein [Streptomyces pactum]
MRPTTRRRWRLLPVVFASACALVLTGCGGGDGGGDDDGTAAPTRTAPRATGDPGPAPAARPTEVIGEARGPAGVVVTLHSAVRDEGGFVTVQGTVTNRGSKSFNALTWRSKETELHSQSSLSGASLVDQAGRKRYLILRDTDGECLCTTGLVGIKVGESRPVFAQFPAPPKDVTEVDFHLPAMPPIRVELTG